MRSHTIALFGEAEKGALCSLLTFSHLPILAESLGHPPDGTYGIHMAVQTLMFEKDLIYIRVQEEGFSIQDYKKGLHLLQQASPKLSAICMPGMGNSDILNQAIEVCHAQGAILITTEKDFYDYMTCFSPLN